MLEDLTPLPANLTPMCEDTSLVVKRWFKKTVGNQAEFSTQSLIPQRSARITFDNDTAKLYHTAPAFTAWKGSDKTHEPKRRNSLSEVMKQDIHKS